MKSHESISLLKYWKIPKIRSGAYIFQRPFWGAYFWRGLYSEGVIYLHFKINWASLTVGRKFTVFALFYFVLILRAISKYTSLGGLFLEGQFNWEFFALQVWGAYIWRGLYMEGINFGILWYFFAVKGTIYLASVHLSSRVWFIM